MCVQSCSCARELAEKRRRKRVTALRSRRAMSKRTATLWKAPHRGTRRARRRGSFRVTEKDHRAERRGGACALEYAGVSACVSISRVFNSGPRATARSPPSSASRRILPTRFHPFGRDRADLSHWPRLEEREREREIKVENHVRNFEGTSHLAGARSSLSSRFHLYVRKRDLAVSFS